MKEIENDLIVPLIQGMIFGARENDLYFNSIVQTEFYPEGYALAQSILPLVSIADESAATDIENVMVAFFPGKVYSEERANDSVRVAVAMIKALSKMDGVDCSKIGTLAGNGFCPGDAIVGLNPASPRSSVSTVSMAVAGLLMMALY